MENKKNKNIRSSYNYTALVGDLLEHFRNKEFDAIVHGCNCFHTMGAGIAKQISLEFPQAYEVDQKTPCGDYAKLGSISIGKTDCGDVINVYTQFYPGTNFEYHAFISCLNVINIQYSGKCVAFPQIGCGIGGADWLYVLNIIEDHLPDVELTIIYYYKHYDKRKNTLGETKTNGKSKM